MTKDQMKQEIREAAKAHSKAERELEKERKRLRRVVKKAMEESPLTGDEVAQSWGKSRQAVYKLLREPQDA